MVFAGQKMAGRAFQGKDTLFRIRGRDKTSCEVERYWKRRQVYPGDLLPVPSTPPDVRYWTPAPASPEASASLDITPTSPEGSAPPRSIPIGGSGNEYVQNIWPLSIVLPPLTSPGHLRDLESILRGTREYYEIYMQQVIGGTNVHLQRNFNSVRTFHSNGLTVAASTEFGFHASAQSALIRSLGALPDILRGQDLDFIICLMKLMSTFSTRKLVQCTRVFLCSVIKETIATCSASHPIVTILQAMWRSFDMILPFAEVLLQLGVDFLTMRLGATHLQTSSVICGLQDVRWNMEDYAGVLQYYEALHESYQHRSTPSEGNGFELMNCQLKMACCHLELGNHGEAARLSEDTLAFCGTYKMEAESSDGLRFYCLRLQGRLRRRLGLPGAVEALEEALAIRRRWYEVDDALAMDVAQELKSFLDERGADSSRTYVEI